MLLEFCGKKMCPLSKYWMYGSKNTTSTLETHGRYNIDFGISILEEVYLCLRLDLLRRKPDLCDIICNFQNSLNEIVKWNLILTSISVDRVWIERRHQSQSSPDRFRDAAHPPAETEDLGRGCHPAVCNQQALGPRRSYSLPGDKGFPAALYLGQELRLKAISRSWNPNAAEALALNAEKWQRLSEDLLGGFSDLK